MKISMKSHIAALVLLSATAGVNARGASSCGGDYSLTSPWSRSWGPHTSCHSRRESNVHSPARRNYNYSRRPYDAIDLASNIFSFPIMTNSLLRQSELGLMSSRMDRATPRYAIQDLEDTIELSMEVPGVKAEDITVEIEDERLLRVKGSRTLMEHGTVSKIEFDQAFDVGDDISTPDIKVELSSGILRISAPKRKYEAKKTKIPIEVRESSSVEEVRVEVEPKVEVDMSSQAQHDNKTREEKEEAQDELTIIEDE